tara:strand:+ start:79 stop:423 length:345 start_codon:yes stop_codon:yes gene_type:complete
MNPQMNKVFSKLAKEDKKTELKSEKVELANIKTIISEYRQINSSATNAEGFILKAKQTLNKSLKSMQGIKKEMDSAQKMAKDLGIESKELNDYEKRINASLSDYEKSIKALNSL